MTLNVGYAASSLILISLFLISLVTQLMNRAFPSGLVLDSHPNDQHSRNDDVRLFGSNPGLGYAKGSLILVTCLAVVLAIWRWSEKSLSVSQIRTT